MSTNGLLEKKYEYSEKQFVYSSNVTDLSSKSEFDERLCKAWDGAMETGAFWYMLDEVKTKNIPGRFGMIAQLNEKRHAQRRKPQSATSVMMPFDENKFHFNKIKDNEHTDLEDWIIINVSPIVYGHVLLVPSPSSRKPQILDEHAIRIAAEMCLLSTTRAFCVGFNSLCALASVNHQHLHTCYIQEEIPIDRCVTRQLDGNVYCLQDFLVNGLVIQLHNNDISVFVKSIAFITNWLSKNNIAHNLFMRRRNSFANRSSIDEGLYVTMYIFPKKVCPGVKEARYLNSCCIDLAGCLLLKDSDEYDNLTEDAALNILRQYTYGNEEFQQLWGRMKEDIVIPTNTSQQ